MARKKIRYEQLNGIIYRVTYPEEGVDDFPSYQKARHLEGHRFDEETAKAIASELTARYAEGWNDALSEMYNKLDAMRNK